MDGPSSEVFSMNDERSPGHQTSKAFTVRGRCRGWFDRTLSFVTPEFLVPLGVVKRSLTIGTKGPSPERSPERGDRELFLWRRFTSTSERSVTLTTARPL